VPAEMEEKELNTRLRLASKEFHEEVMTPLAITPREPPLVPGAPSKPRPDWTPVFKHVKWQYERKKTAAGRDVFIVRAPASSPDVGGANYIYNYLEGLAKGVAVKHGLQVYLVHGISAKKQKPELHEFHLQFAAPSERLPSIPPHELTRLPPAPARAPTRLPPAPAGPKRETKLPPKPGGRL